MLIHFNCSDKNSVINRKTIANLFGKTLTELTKGKHKLQDKQIIWKTCISSEMPLLHEVGTHYPTPLLF